MSSSMERPKWLVPRVTYETTSMPEDAIRQEDASPPGKVCQTFGIISTLREEITWLITSTGIATRSVWS